MGKQTKNTGLNLMFIDWLAVREEVRLLTQF